MLSDASWYFRFDILLYLSGFVTLPDASCCCMLIAAHSCLKVTPCPCQTDSATHSTGVPLDSIFVAHLWILIPMTDALRRSLTDSVSHHANLPGNLWSLMIDGLLHVRATTICLRMGGRGESISRIYFSTSLCIWIHHVDRIRFDTGLHHTALQPLQSLRTHARRLHHVRTRLILLKQAR